MPPLLAPRHPRRRVGLRCSLHLWTALGQSSRERTATAHPDRKPAGRVRGTIRTQSQPRADGSRPRRAPPRPPPPPPLRPCRRRRRRRRRRRGRRPPPTPTPTPTPPRSMARCEQGLLLGQSPNSALRHSASTSPASASELRATKPPPDRAREPHRPGAVAHHRPPPTRPATAARPRRCHRFRGFRHQCRRYCPAEAPRMTVAGARGRRHSEHASGSASPAMPALKVPEPQSKTTVVAYGGGGDVDGARGAVCAVGGGAGAAVGAGGGAAAARTATFSSSESSEDDRACCSSAYSGTAEAINRSAGPPLWAAGSNRACTTRTTAGGPHGCRGLPRPYSVVERYCTLIKSKLPIGYLVPDSTVFICTVPLRHSECSYCCPGGTLLNRYGCVYVGFYGLNLTLASESNLFGEGKSAVS